MKSAHVFLGTVLLAAAPATAHEPKPATPPVAAPRLASAAVTAVEAFHHALADGDRDAALALLLPEVVIFESGGAELSRDEYADHHLGPDMAFSGATRSGVVDRQVHEAGDVAWVLTRSRTTGTFRDRDVDLDGTETMVLRRVGNDWRIAHVHWSSQPHRASD